MVEGWTRLPSSHGDDGSLMIEARWQQTPEAGEVSDHKERPRQTRGGGGRVLVCRELRRGLACHEWSSP